MILRGAEHVSAELRYYSRQRGGRKAGDDSLCVLIVEGSKHFVGQVHSVKFPECVVVTVLIEVLVSGF